MVQFQTINPFIFGAITSNHDYIMYKPMDSPEMKEFNDFIINVKTHDLDQLKVQLNKTLDGMFKAGATKTADILIPRDQKLNRFIQFVKIQSNISADARINFRYNITMFSKEQDFLLNQRMLDRSSLMKKMYLKVIEETVCDTIIYIPMIDGINLTARQVTKYEKPNYSIPV